MDTILDSFAPDKLFPNPNLLDLEDLNESDFLTNVHFSEQMEDFSNELFNSFFDDHLLAERTPLLDMELEPQNPDIQQEHSYSLSGDSAPQSPSMPIKSDDDSDGMWAFSQDLTAILVKQEPNLLSEPSSEPVTSMPTSSCATQPITLNPPPQRRHNHDKVFQGAREQNSLNMVPTIKAEPREVNQFLKEHLQLPPTPPSSHGSDSDGSQSPHSLPPSSPTRIQSPHSLAPSSPTRMQSPHSLAPSSPARHPARSSTAISSSPLLTAPHKLQGTSGPLMLTEEEKRTLMAEGYPVPNKLPLTKTEEKALKRVRRKIKNKISAQESRRKKKEVENYTSENSELWKKVETLEGANRSLLQQLQKLQALVSGKVPRSCKMASTQTGTCLMLPVAMKGLSVNCNLLRALGVWWSGALTVCVVPPLGQVVALCFVLVLGSLAPCLSELSLYSSSTSSSFSSPSHTVKSGPLPTTHLYTSSQGMCPQDD
ncbi:Cyclic AMP-responsive element-binding protein 3-like protein 1 [Bagarius yarrelli]|uniref:Cyclic AMP-responsive element-binding protein 3-like protein 1 n=1 Tax=Bagarius yarrelli TaxID=175774 RepID=A0A556VC78_BAGYA|nr:Cyclic AMP-responsive element-binding protein 3-like protein 1 [Bagarius yarrelli]